MNFCPECGTKLGDYENKQGRCGHGHSLNTSTGVIRATVHEVEVVAVKKKEERKLPETDDERAEAYFSALTRLNTFFTKTAGFESYVSEAGTLMVGKGTFLLDAKIVPNDGRTAYVTSNADYNPLKAGTKDSRATVVTSRTVMKASNLLRITVSHRQTATPIFVELRKNIQDPEAHICKSVMFVLQDALDKGSILGRTIRDVSHLKDVPPEWLPKPGDYDTLFGMPSGSTDLPQLPDLPI